MKLKLTLCLAFLIMLSNFAFSQAPNSFKYQSMIRKADGTVLANQTISVKISILKGSTSGEETYSEVHSITSNVFGIININIGEGSNINGLISSIDWSSESYFVKIEMDETGGTNYSLTSVSQLLSVPYALNANTVNFIEWSKVQNKPSFFSGSFIDLSDKPAFFSGSYNDLTNLPNLFSGSYNDLTDKPVLSSYALKSYVDSLITISDAVPTIDFVYTLSYYEDSSTILINSTPVCNNVSNDAIYTWSCRGISSNIDLSNHTLNSAGWYFGKFVNTDVNGLNTNIYITLDVYIPVLKKHFSSSKSFLAIIKSY